MTKKPTAYEWHNHETGHCYVDYIPHPEQDIKDGYIRTPLYTHPSPEPAQQPASKPKKLVCPKCKTGEENFTRNGYHVWCRNCDYEFNIDITEPSPEPVDLKAEFANFLQRLKEEFPETNLDYFDFALECYLSQREGKEPKEVICPLCRDTGDFSYGGSFGGATMTKQCSCGAKDLRDGKINIVIQYVHQLQNLYFALTGHELELTEKPQI